MPNFRRTVISLPLLLAALLAGCASIPSSGPSTREVEAAALPGASAIQVVEVDDAVTRSLLAQRTTTLFSEKLGNAADAAMVQGLAVNAGHDLTVANMPQLAARIPGLAEVSIGHGLTADALIHGMDGTVKRFLKACGW